MQKYLQNTQKAITVLSICFIMFIAGCNKGYPEAEEISYETAEIVDTKDSLLNALKASPNDIKTEDTLVSYIYDKCIYFNHTGIMTYYMVENKVLYSRWETFIPDAQEAAELYSAICESLEEDYKKSSEEEKKLSKVSNWCSNKDKKTITYLERENDIMVSVMCQP